MKKIILWGIILIVLVSLCVVYLFVFGGSEQIQKLWNKSSSPDQESPAAVTPPARNNLSLIFGKKTVAPVLSFGEDRIYFFDENGQLYRSLLEGKTMEILSISDYRPVISVFWPKSGSNFIAKWNQPGYDGEAFRLYAADTKKFVNLPNNVESAAWLPDGERYVYVWRRGDGARELKITDVETNQYSKLADLTGFYDLTTSPAGDIILLRQRAISGEVNQVLKFNLADKSLVPLLDRGSNLDLLFSPDGGKLLFSRLDGESGLPELWFYDFQTRAFRNLGINTVASKAVWNEDGSRFYFGLPKALTADDFMASMKTEDVLLNYDLGSGAQQKIEMTSAAIDFRDLLLKDDESALFFLNGWDEKLYRLDLK